MTKEKGKRMRKNQKGFTIVELLIAISILSIVVAAVCGFILVGSRNYSSANSDISVQQEAQLAMNQISDVLIDTSRSVTYVGYDAGGNSSLVLKDSEFSFEPVEKCLIMYNGALVVKESAVPGGTPAASIEPGNGNKHYQFYWNKEEETLYYTEQDVQPTDVDTENQNNVRFPDFGDPGWVVLAEHVTKFEVDLTQVEEKRVVQLELTFVNGLSEYNTSNNVTIRNKVGVNDAQIVPIDRNKSVSVIPKELSVILEPGETYHFSTPKVTGQNVTDKSVTWSMGPEYSGSSFFSDAQNGILQVSANEPVGSFTVVITTNATDQKGRHAEAVVNVNIKRVTSVALSIPGNSTNIVEAGTQFQVQASVGGSSLGLVCDGCGDSTNKDYDVVDQGGIYNWEVIEGAEFVSLEDSGAKSGEFKVDLSAAEGAVIRIRATSYLSTLKTYKAVQGELVLTVEAGENAKPFSGKLEYGDHTIMEEIRAGLSTDHPRYVTAVRVVDNSGKEKDKVLLYFTIGGGNNYRITPDLFDLDLNGSYTFYMQALDPVSYENRKLYEEHKVDSVIEDDAETIREEYFSHLDDKKPYGYIGKKYPCNEVYYSVLNKPKVTYQYKGINYKGENITYDPVNIYSVSAGSGIIGEIRPVDYESVWGDSWNSMTNSLYEGEGNDSSQWKGLYYYDEKSMSYQGSTSLAEGTAVISPKSSMLLKLDREENKLLVCGNYHIVPGILYRNEDPGFYEIIGWDGFDFPNLPRQQRYYEFDDSTIHVRVTSEFTMDIADDWFKGKVLFPLPSQMAGDAVFPNVQNTQWQISGGGLTVLALAEGWSNAQRREFTYVRYRYIPKKDLYEVEPFEVKYQDKKILTHSYGVYYCEENASKWERRPGTGYTQEKELVLNVKDFEYNGGKYLTYFPLPTDSDFPFLNGTGQASYKTMLYDNNMQNRETLSGILVTCKMDKDTYEIEFIKKMKEQNQENHKITIVSYGTYTWKTGQKEWTWKAGANVTYDTDLLVNLKDLERDGKKYKLYFPLPTENDFPFKGGVKKITDYKPAAYEMSDLYGERPDKNTAYTVEYEKMGDTCQIAFVDRIEPQQWGSHKVTVKSYGTYVWSPGEEKWTQTAGAKETFECNLAVNLEGMQWNGQSYKMRYPLPQDADFPFSATVTESYDLPETYLLDDLYCENLQMLSNIRIQYEKMGDEHQITFCGPSWAAFERYGTFRLKDGETVWRKVP